MYKLAKLEYKTWNFLVIHHASARTVQTELREGGSATCATRGFVSSFGI